MAKKGNRVQVILRVHRAQRFWKSQELLDILQRRTKRIHRIVWRLRNLIQSLKK